MSIQTQTTLDSLHCQPISDLQSNHQGNIIATCSRDGNILIYDLSEHQQQLQLAGKYCHQHPINSILFIKDSVLVAVDSQGSVLVLQIEQTSSSFGGIQNIHSNQNQKGSKYQFKLRNIKNDHNSDITSLTRFRTCFILTADVRGIIKFWVVDDKLELGLVQSIQNGNEGVHCLTANYDLFVAANVEGKLNVYQFDERVRYFQQIQIGVDQVHDVNDLQFSPGIGASNFLMACNSKGEVLEFLIDPFEKKILKQQVVFKLNNEICKINFNQSGNMLALNYIQNDQQESIILAQNLQGNWEHLK